MKGRGRCAGVQSISSCGFLTHGTLSDKLTIDHKMVAIMTHWNVRCIDRSSHLFAEELCLVEKPSCEDAARLIAPALVGKHRVQEYTPSKLPCAREPYRELLLLYGLRSWTSSRTRILRRNSPLRGALSNLTRTFGDCGFRVCCTL